MSATDKQVASLILGNRDRGLPAPCDDHVAGLSRDEISAAFDAMKRGTAYFTGHECEDDGHEPQKHRATDKQAGWLFAKALDAGIPPLDKSYVIDNLTADEVRALVAEIDAGNDPLSDLRALAARPGTSSRPRRSERSETPLRALTPHARASSPYPARIARDTDPAKADDALIDVLRDIATTLHTIADRMEKTP